MVKITTVTSNILSDFVATKVFDSVIRVKSTADKTMKKVFKI